MELKDFVKNVIIDLDKAVSEANKETSRDVRFRGVKEQRTSVEFDVAVTAESTGKAGKGGGIKVLGMFQAGVDGSSEEKNTIVSRVSFSLDVSSKTRDEELADITEEKSQSRPNPGL